MANKTSRRKKKYSGIGGQAVLEGVMMKNKEKYAVAVRKPSGEIAVEVENFQGMMHGSRLLEIPFIRGVFNFINSLVLGTRSLNYSASFYEEDEEGTMVDKALDKVSGGRGEKMISLLVTLISIVLALGLFVLLPYFISSYFEGFIRNHSLLMILEGLIRIAIFLGYVVAISMMKDIRRLYQYHGAEHKCINCIEHGMELTPENVMKCSRQHKRCGTSFMLIVICCSVIVFLILGMFHIESRLWRLLWRLILIPVIAGLSYELLRYAAISDSKLVCTLTKPGLALQKLVTREPDREMCEVAIKAIEAVFDWKEWQKKSFREKSV